MLKIIYGLIFVLFLLGGLGLSKDIINYIGVIGFSFLLLLLHQYGFKIKFPRSIKQYGFFLLLFLLSIFWSRDPFTTYDYFLLFLSGSIAWIFFYNLKVEDKSFEKFLIILGIIFALLFIGQMILGVRSYNEYSLYLYMTNVKNHSHIGDLWAIIVVLFMYRWVENKKNLINILIIGVGLVLIILSLSRSAVVSGMAGFLYLVKNQKIKESIPPGIFKLVLGIFVLLLIFLSLNKSLIFNRPYYWQVIIGLIQKPFGVGVGNFAFISYFVQNLIPGFHGYSYIAHNLILELVAGVGILSFVFVFWFFKELFTVFQTKNPNRFAYELIFIVLTVNFMFDVTYFVPSMLWLWFGTLGLIEK